MEQPNLSKYVVELEGCGPVEVSIELYCTAPLYCVVCRSGPRATRPATPPSSPSTTAAAPTWTGSHSSTTRTCRPRGTGASGLSVPLHCTALQVPGAARLPAWTGGLRTGHDHLPRAERGGAGPGQPAGPPQAGPGGGARHRSRGQHCGQVRTQPSLPGARPGTASCSTALLTVAHRTQVLVNCSPGESSGLAALLKGKRTGQAGEQNSHNVALFSQAVKSRDEILSRCECELLLKQGFGEWGSYGFKKEKFLTLY